MPKSFTRRTALEHFLSLPLDIAVLFSILYIWQAGVAQRLLGEFILQFSVLC